MSNSVAQVSGRIEEGMAKVLVGAGRMTLGLTIALLARGHVLIEGVPGTGKTLAVRALAVLLGLEFRRIAFTPDLMPSDVVGTTVFNPQTAQFATRIGPIVGQRRARRRGQPHAAQDAVGAARGDGRGPRHDRRRALSAAAAVLALRDAEPDRVRGDLSAARGAARPLHGQGRRPRIRRRAQELELLARSAAGFDARELEASHVLPVTNAAEVIDAQHAVRRVHLSEGVREYTYRIVAATRTHPRLTLGASPRAGIALLTAAQAAAAIAGRDFATPDDVKDTADLVLPHRLIVAPEAEIEGISARDALRDVLAAIPVPRGDLSS